MFKNKASHYIMGGWLGLISAILVLGGTVPASAFTSAQATAIWNSYNNSFYVGGNAYYRVDQGGGQNTNNFWENAEEIEMAVDRAQRSGSSSDQSIVTALVNGFDSTYGSTWTNYTIYNDDVMWACIAHLRAYFVTGSTNSNWASEAANNFNAVYNGGSGRSVPQYDGTYGGGMWWSTDHSSTGTKNACVNGPAAIAAYYLSTIWPTGTGFRSQAQNMYNWEKSTLVSSAGFVYDHTGSSGVTGADLSYNAGTCIGAAYLLGDSATAGNVATYFMNNCCGANGILPDYGSTGGNNNDGFNGIFMRWTALYMIDSGTQSTYSNWLYNNAAAALFEEDPSGLSWDDWSAATPGSGLYSWDCSASVVALQVLPPNSQTVPNGRYEIAAATTGNCLDCINYGNTDGTLVQVWPYAGTTNQLWDILYLGNGYYSIRTANGGRSLDCTGCSPNDGTVIELWDWNGGTTCQEWAINPSGTGVYNIATLGAKSDGTHDVLDGENCSGAAGTHIDLWGWGGGSCQQQWNFIPQ